jgi:hypothetical protein
MAYQNIDPTECMGDSLFKINNNAANFDTRIDQLNTLIATLTGILNTTITQAVPAGAVYSFVQPVPPTGWISCEGVIVPNGVGTVTTSFGNINADFTNLHVAVGTKFGAAGQLPDLRGYFVRGHGTNSDGTAATGNLGRKQVDTVKPHTHTGTTVSGGSHEHNVNIVVGSTGAGSALMAANAASNEFPTGRIDVQPSGAHTHTFTTDSAGSVETAPKNISLLYCIKY